MGEGHVIEDAGGATESCEGGDVVVEVGYDMRDGSERKGIHPESTLYFRAIAVEVVGGAKGHSVGVPASSCGCGLVLAFGRRVRRRGRPSDTVRARNQSMYCKKRVSALLGSRSLSDKSHSSFRQKKHRPRDVARAKRTARAPPYIAMAEH